MNETNSPQPIKTKKIDLFNLSIGIGVLITILLAGYLGFLIFKPNFSSITTQYKLSSKISPDILYLTQPVNSLTGKVVSINDGSITINFNASYNSTNVIASPLGGATANPIISTPSAVTKNLEYTVHITNSTAISRFPNSIPYLFKANNNAISPVPANLSDIKKGDTVSITTTTDVRTTDPRQIFASEIRLSQPINIIKGVIENINGQTLTVKGTVILTNPQAELTEGATSEKSYTLTYDDSLEISYINFSGATPTNTKLSTNDLKIGSRYTFYTEKDILNSANGKVMRIEPEIITVNPTFTNPVP